MAGYILRCLAKRYCMVKFRTILGPLDYSHVRTVCGVGMAGSKLQKIMQKSFSFKHKLEPFKFQAFRSFKDLTSLVHCLVISIKRF